jgi:hypothetical protein
MCRQWRCLATTSGTLQNGNVGKPLGFSAPQLVETVRNGPCGNRDWSVQLSSRSRLSECHGRKVAHRAGACTGCTRHDHAGARARRSCCAFGPATPVPQLNSMCAPAPADCTGQSCRSRSNPHRIDEPRGRSSMVELQVPNLITWVRFPSPAPLFCGLSAHAGVHERATTFPLEQSRRATMGLRLLRE